VVGFVFLIWKYFIEQRKIGIELIGFLTALIFLTRLSVVIPIIILLFSTFYRFSFTEKLRFILIFILTAGSILFLFFYHATDLNMIFKYNPFTIQGTKQPLLLSVFFLMLSLVLSFKLKSFRHLVYWIGFLLFTPVFISFILYLREYGCNNAIINSYFDLSFFNMSMPFVIVAIVLEFFVKNHKEYKI
jgi:hypothetical protein